MTILIKGMDMPKNGSWKTIRIYYDGTCAKPNWQGDCTLMQGCEAIPIPLHGRLGDLDALAKQVEYERFHHAHTDGLAARHHVAEYGHFLKEIADAPTIIPAELSKEES